MQRDDLRAVTPRPCGLHDQCACSIEVSRPVTDVEVLEALGAKRHWHCECVEDYIQRCHPGHHGHWPHNHCRWVWVVEADDE